MLAFIFGTSLVALTSSSSSNGSGSNNNSYWRPERFLSIISASVLFYVARNDFLEWKEENYQHNDQTKNAERRSSVEILYPKKKEKKQDEENKNYIYSNSNNNSRSIELKDFTNNNTTTPQPQQQLRSRSYASRQSSRDLEAAGESDEKDDESDNTNNNGDGDDDDDDDDDEEIRAKVEEASKSLRRFVTVCVMGTLDDMIVFSAFVAGGGGGGSKGNGTGLDGTDETVDVDGDELEFRHNNFALFIGTTLAALLIVAISWFFSEIECFKRIVKKIPMWALLTGIAIYILVMGLI